MTAPTPARPDNSVAHLVGICPLLLLATDTASALVLAAAIVLVAALALPLKMLQWRAPNARAAIGIVALAAATGVVQLMLDSLSHGLHALTSLGVPLIAANVALWAGSPQSTDPRNTPTILRDAVSAAFAVLLLGMLRELFAQGTLFATAAEYFGNAFANWALRWSASSDGLLLFARPAGALFALACLIAALQALRLRRQSVSSA